MSQQDATSAVEAIIGYEFNNKAILWSSLHAAGSFYGLVLLTDLLSTGASQGDKDRTTSDICSNQNLADICIKTGIHRYINRNQSQPGEQAPKTRTATIEAILAAVFLDSERDITVVRSVMASLGLKI